MSKYIVICPKCEGVDVEKISDTGVFECQNPACSSLIMFPDIEYITEEELKTKEQKS